MGLSENNERPCREGVRSSNGKSLPLLGLIAHKLTRRTYGFGRGGGARGIRTRGTVIQLFICTLPGKRSLAPVFLNVISRGDSGAILKGAASKCGHSNFC